MGVTCLGDCAKNGTSYWWCFTDEASKEWEYCSPPGEVLDTAYTVNGQDCIGECATQDEDYWWCQKSPRSITQTGITVHRILNVRGTTSLAPTLVKAEVNLTTGATLDPPGTTAALLLRRWSR